MTDIDIYLVVHEYVGDQLGASVEPFLSLRGAERRAIQMANDNRYQRHGSLLMWHGKQGNISIQQKVATE